MVDLINKRRESAHWYLARAVEHHGKLGQALTKTDFVSARRHHEHLGKSINDIAKAIGAPAVAGPTTALHQPEGGPSYGLTDESEELQQKQAASLGGDFRKIAFEESQGSFEHRFQKAASAALHNTECTGLGYRKSPTGCSLTTASYAADIQKLKAKLDAMPAGNVSKLLKRSFEDLVERERKSSPFTNGCNLRESDVGF